MIVLQVSVGSTRTEVYIMQKRALQEVIRILSQGDINLHTKFIPPLEYIFRVNECSEGSHFFPTVRRIKQGLVLGKYSELAGVLARLGSLPLKHAEPHSTGGTQGGAAQRGSEEGGEGTAEGEGEGLEQRDC